MAKINQGSQPKFTMASILPKLASGRQFMGQYLVERKMETMLVLVARVTGRHLFLVGIPGTAKTMLIDMSESMFQGYTSFRAQVTRDTALKHLVGDIDIPRFVNDGVMEINMDGMMLESNLVHLCEAGLANATLQGGLLNVMTDGKFRDGKRVIETDITFVADANTMPAQKDVAANDIVAQGQAAFASRFILRHEVPKYIRSADGRERLDGLPELRKLQKAWPSAPDPILRAEGEWLRDQVLTMASQLPASVRQVKWDVIDALRGNGIRIIDRTAKGVNAILVAWALLNDRDHVVPSDVIETCRFWAPEDLTDLPKIFTHLKNFIHVGEVAGNRADEIDLACASIAAEALDTKRAFSSPDSGAKEMIESMGRLSTSMSELDLLSRKFPNEADAVLAVKSKVQGWLARVDRRRQDFAKDSAKATHTGTGAVQ